MYTFFLMLMRFKTGNLFTAIHTTDGTNHVGGTEWIRGHKV